MNSTHRTAQAGAERGPELAMAGAVVSMGLLAGLVYDWSVGVMPALMAADDRTLVDAARHTVDNPAFPLTFVVAGGLSGVALFQARRSGADESARWIAGGLALYAVALVVTFVIHIPLNEELKDAGDPAAIEDIAAVRDDFAGPWAAWNVVRALATAGALGAVTWALALRSRRTRA